MREMFFGNSLQITRKNTNKIQLITYEISKDISSYSRKKINDFIPRRK